MKVPPGIPCNEPLAAVDYSDLSANEKATFKVLKAECARWKRILKMDPIWEIYVIVLSDEQMGGASAAADIGETEYFRCTILVRHSALNLAKDDARFKEMRRIVCHEMIHASTADYHRMTIAAASPKMRPELDYRYEQMVVRMTAAFTALDDAQRKKKRKKDDEPSDP